MKLRHYIVLSLLALSTSANACESDGKKDGLPTLKNCPKEVDSIVARAIGCQHFAGETMGDGGERDQYIRAQVKKMNCPKVKTDRSAIEKKYATDPSVARTIQKIFADYQIEE